MSKCKLCQKEITGGALGCSLGTICMRCADNTGLAKYQPLQSMNEVLWVMAETYFRLGKGEDVSFKQVWNERDGGLKLVNTRFHYVFEC